MNENIKKFLVKLEQSPDLQAQFKQIREPDEAYKLAASIQDGFTKEEFVYEMKKIHEAHVKQSEGLSEEDLDKVAGGLTTEEATIIFSVGAPVMAAIAAI